MGSRAVGTERIVPQVRCYEMIQSGVEAEYMTNNAEVLPVR